MPAELLIGDESKPESSAVTCCFVCGGEGTLFEPTPNFHYPVPGACCRSRNRRLSTPLIDKTGRLIRGRPLAGGIFCRYPDSDVPQPRRTAGAGEAPAPLNVASGGH